VITTRLSLIFIGKLGVQRTRNGGAGKVFLSLRQPREGMPPYPFYHFEC
jgi:hypothetical protein